MVMGLSRGLARLTVVSAEPVASTTHGWQILGVAQTGRSESVPHPGDAGDCDERTKSDAAREEARDKVKAGRIALPRIGLAGLGPSLRARAGCRLRGKG